MKEITRYFDATKTTDYILPAITLGNDKAIHIGMDKGDGKTACLCGQHHKQTGDVWSSPEVAEEPDITCGSCLRSMKALIRSTEMRPFLVIMEAIGQKISTAKFHIKQERTNTSTSDGPYDVKPESRVINSFPIDGITAHELGNKNHNNGFNIINIVNGTVSNIPICTPVCITNTGRRIESRITFNLLTKHNNIKSNITIVAWGWKARILKHTLLMGNIVSISGSMFSYNESIKLLNGTEVLIDKIGIRLSTWEFS